MRNAYRDIAFTPSVLSVQEAQDSRKMYDRPANPEHPNDRLGEAERAFLQRCESFYLASVSETGWPYVQHRGGPAGFLHVIDAVTLGWAEFAGNRQYVTTGNLKGDDRVSLFVMDYANQARLKLFGRAHTVATDSEAAKPLLEAEYSARIERVMIVRIAGFDWNCPQHIPALFSVDDVAATTQKLLSQIATLEAQLDGQTGA